MISILKNMSPDAKIIVMTPFYGIYKDTNDTFIGDTYVVSNGYGTLADYAKKAKNVSEDEGCIDKRLCTLLSYTCVSEMFGIY